MYTPDTTKLLTREQAASTLGVGLSTLYNLEKSGKIRSLKITPKKSRFEQSEVDRYLSVVLNGNSEE